MKGATLIMGGHFARFRILKLWSLRNFHSMNTNTNQTLLYSSPFMSAQKLLARSKVARSFGWHLEYSFDVTQENLFDKRKMEGWFVWSVHCSGPKAAYLCSDLCICILAHSSHKQEKQIDNLINWIDRFKSRSKPALSLSLSLSSFAA